MLNKNEIEIEIKIVPKEPLLIKKGDEAPEEQSNNIKWNRDSNGIYIPGSTLKGMFRDRFYKIWYEYKKYDEDKLQENRFNEDKMDDDKIYNYEKNLFERFNKGEIDEEQFIKSSLRLSKLFGSIGLKSRLFIEDATLIDKTEEKLNIKSITPIDRFTGGAIVPLKYEYTKGCFKTSLRIKNIEKDELKTFLYIVRDSYEGDIKIGSSQTRGFGEIELEIKNISFREYNGYNSFNLSKFELDKDNSLKIGEKYLYKVYKLDKGKDENFNILKEIVG